MGDNENKEESSESSSEDRTTISVNEFVESNCNSDDSKKNSESNSSKTDSDIRKIPLLRYLKKIEIGEKIEKTKDKIEKMTFKDTFNYVKENFNYKDDTKSTALDILAVYLGGQKILFTEAKSYCEDILNYLMIPAIFITSICTIVSIIIDNQYGKILVSALNAVNGFLLSLIRYLKLDAKAEAHKISAYKYDKIESYCEFKSGKLLFFENDEDIKKVINYIESSVKEIRETNQFILPEKIRKQYPLIYNTNVFSSVKILQNKELGLINELKNIINKTIDLLNNDHEPNSSDIKLLEMKQNLIIQQLILFKNNYLKF